MTVTAEGDVRVLVLSRERFAHLRETDADLYGTMLQIFLHMIHDEQQRMLAVIAGTRTAETPSFGTPDSTSDMTGGMGFAGLAGH